MSKFVKMLLNASTDERDSYRQLFVSVDNDNQSTTISQCSIDTLEAKIVDS